jgi:hypothetical protein
MGSADSGTTVKLYTTSGCTGTPAAMGPAATFASPGLEVTVGDNTTITFKATASDAANNTSACSSGLAYTEDSAAPNTMIDSGPPDPTNDPTPTFTFSSNEGSSTFECRVDSNPFATCTSPHTTAMLTQDAHTFEVKATDQAGNTDQSPASDTFTVDTQAPATPSVTDTDPGSPANDNTPEVMGSAEAGSTVKLYTTSDCTGSPAATGPAADFAASGLTVTVADNTTTTFKATATDAANNPSGCSSGLVYTEDSVTPSSSTSFPVDGTSYRSSAYAAGCDDATPDVCGTAADNLGGSGVDQVEVRIQRTSDDYFWNGSGWQVGLVWDTATGDEVWNFWAYPFNPMQGIYQVTSRATDAAGNEEGTTTITFTIDDTAPQTTIDSPPPGTTQDPTPTFFFSSNEGNSTFECRVDGAPFANCSSPHTTAALSVGPHTFDVQAIDAAGNMDPTPASQSFTVESPPEPLLEKILVLKAKPKRVERGDRVKLIVTVNGPCDDDPVDFYKGNRKIATQPVGEDCVASIRKKLVKTATFVAIMPLREDHLGGTSNKVKVRVRD